MTPDLHPELDDLIFYCMGSVDAPEAAAVMDRVRAHLQQCAECRAQVEDIQADMALVSMSVPQIPPPAEAKERLFQEAGVPLPGPTGRSASIKTFPLPVAEGFRGGGPIRPRRPHPALLWGGWVAAMLLLFYAVRVRVANQQIQHQLQIETAQLQQSNATRRVPGMCWKC